MKEGREVVASWRLRRSMRVVERECRLEDEEEGEEEEEEGKGERRDQSMSRDMRWERKREKIPRKGDREGIKQRTSVGKPLWWQDGMEIGSGTHSRRASTPLQVFLSS